MVEPVKLLVVDDEMEAAVDIARQLTSLGYCVSGVCHNGNEAIEQARALRPDLVLMDVDLQKGIDSIQTGEFIDTLCDIPVIFLTDDDAQLKQQVQSSHTFGYLQKPLQTCALTFAVELAIAKHAYVQRLRESAETWRSLIAKTPNHILFVNDAGIIQFYNHTYPDGRRLEGESIFTYIEPGYQAAARAALEQVMLRGETAHYQAPVTMPEGQRRWFDIQSLLMVDKNNTRHAAMIAIDIDDQIQMRRALAESLAEIEHSHALISALGHVAARIQQTPEPEVVLQTLGEELHTLGITYTLLMLDPLTLDLEIHDTSIPKPLLAKIESAMGAKFIGSRISRSTQSEPKTAFENRPIFFANITERVSTRLPELPLSLIKLILFGGLAEGNVKMTYLPLLTNQQSQGGLVLWGSGLREDDLPSLEIFANQVAITIENARLLKETQKLSITDSLTGAYNMRYFMEIAHREFDRSKRSNLPFALMMFDVDFFKRINDTYGHPVGDRVLQHITARAQTHLRRVDTIARYGGEEFIILLPDTNLPHVRTAAHRLLHAVNSAKMHIDGHNIAVTISLGIADFRPATETLDELIHRVDLALYLAKDAGRNCVMDA